MSDNNQSYTQVNLGSQGIRYLKSQLEQGSFFAKCLASRDLEQGRMEAYYPSSFAISRDVKLDKSIYLEYGERIKDESDEIIVKKTKQFLAEETHRVGIFETLMRKGDRAVESLQLSHAFYMQEVYLLLDHESNSEIIDRAIKKARGYPFVGGLIALSDEVYQNIKFPIFSISKPTLRQLCNSTCQIIIGIHDEEGYATWKSPTNKRHCIAVL